MTGASLGVAIIGKSLAQARGLLPKHAIKQVDRLLSNRKLEAWDIFATWVPELVGSRTDLIVAMDWTDFAADGPLALKLVTRHGRATPLVWLSVLKDELTDARNDYEDACLRRLAEVLPDGVDVPLLADPGFADAKLFSFLDELGFGYVIRFRSNILVSAADGPTRPASDWIGQSGRARKLRAARITAARCPVGAVVCVQAKGMKEAWCLAASDAAAPSRQIIELYSKRWGVDMYQPWCLSKVYGDWKGERPVRGGVSRSRFRRSSSAWSTGISQIGCPQTQARRPWSLPRRSQQNSVWWGMSRRWANSRTVISPA